MTNKKELPPAPPGFSWKPEVLKINSIEVPSFTVAWKTDTGPMEATFRKKLPLGQRIAAMEAFGETITDEGRVGFLAAASIESATGYHAPPNRTRADMLRALDVIDDTGLMAWMRAKAEMTEASDTQAANAATKAALGN